jgi:hypothetical protein
MMSRYCHSTPNANQSSLQDVEKISVIGTLNHVFLSKTPLNRKNLSKGNNKQTKAKLKLPNSLKVIGGAGVDDGKIRGLASKNQNIDYSGAP